MYTNTEILSFSKVTEQMFANKYDTAQWLIQETSPLWAKFSLIFSIFQKIKPRMGQAPLYGLAHSLVRNPGSAPAHLYQFL